MKNHVSTSPRNDIYVAPNGDIFPMKKNTAAPDDAVVIRTCCETMTVEKPVAPHKFTDAQCNIVTRNIILFLNGKKDDKDQVLYTKVANGGSDVVFGLVPGCDNVFRVDRPGCDYNAASVTNMNVALGNFMGLKPKKSSTTGNAGNNGGQSNGGSNNGQSNGGQSNGGQTGNNGQSNGGQSNGGQTGNNGGSNNGQSNGGQSNGGSNNGQTGNNGGQSNGGQSNGGSNNGQSNGGQSNGGQSNGGSNNGQTNGGQSGNGNGQSGSNNGGQTGNNGSQSNGGQAPKPNLNVWNDQNRDANIDAIFANYGVPGYGKK